MSADPPMEWDQRNQGPNDSKGPNESQGPNDYKVGNGPSVPGPNESKDQRSRIRPFCPWTKGAKLTPLKRVRECILWSADSDGP